MKRTVVGIFLLELLVAVAVLYARILPKIGCSYDLDELATLWYANKPFLEMVRLNWLLLGHSPLFLTVLWPLKQLGGCSEWWLRLFPLMGFFCGACALYYTAAVVAEANTAAWAVLLYLIIPELQSYAVIVRPYSWAMAFAVFSVGLSVRALADKRFVWAAAAAVALTVYSHYIYAPILGIVLLAMLFFCRGEYRRALRLFGVIAVAAGVLCVPLCFQLQLIASTAHERMDSTLSWVAILKALLEAPYLGVAVGVVAVMGVARAWIRKEAPVSGVRGLRLDNCVCLAALWAAAPFFCGALLQLTCGITLSMRRYYAWFLPGEALLGARLVSLILREDCCRVFRMSAFVVAVALPVSGLFRSFQIECSDNWRGAVEFLRANGYRSGDVVLLRSGHTETRVEGWLSRPYSQELTKSPLTEYGVDGRIVSLPFSADMPENARDVVNEELRETIVAGDQVVFYVGRELGEQSMFELVRESLAKIGFSGEQSEVVEGTRRQVFRRQNPESRETSER